MTRWQLEELCDAEQLGELEAWYELEPWSVPGSDEALAALVTTMRNFGPYPPEKPVTFEDVCPRLKQAQAKPEKQSEAELRTAIDLTMQVWRSHARR